MGVYSFIEGTFNAVKFRGVTVHVLTSKFLELVVSIEGTWVHNGNSFVLILCTCGTNMCGTKWCFSARLDEKAESIPRYPLRLLLGTFKFLL